MFLSLTLRLAQVSFCYYYPNSLSVSLRSWPESRTDLEVDRRDADGQSQCSKSSIKVMRLCQSWLCQGLTSKEIHCREKCTLGGEQIAGAILLHKQSYCQYGPINPFKIVGHPGTRMLGVGPLARGRDWQYISDLMGGSSAQGTKEVGRGM